MQQASDLHAPVSVAPLRVTIPVRSSFEEPSMPAKRLSSVVLPAPDGPMMAKRSPDTTCPAASRRIVFLGFASSVTEHSRKSKVTSFDIRGCVDDGTAPCAMTTARTVGAHERRQLRWSVKYVGLLLARATNHVWRKKIWCRSGDSYHLSTRDRGA